VFGGHQFFNLGVFSNQRWIRDLPIEKAKGLPNALCFLRISTVEQYLVLVRAIVLPFRSSRPMMKNGRCALPIPTRGRSPTLAYRSRRTGRRSRIVKIKRDVENQIRGLLKNLGLVIGRAKMNTFAGQAAELAADRPELAAAVDPLLRAREAVEQQIFDLDCKVLRLARNNAQVRRFMTVPGVGPVTALCFFATIDDPARFKRSRSVGAYAGLTTRRYASGEIDRTGRISKCGDKIRCLRSTFGAE
jgi:Transposase IS116/IS110/IS902 family